tara:strand:- start:1212 stop:1652 length:441 start_codon:yes stop_codon:yes gene_type:complete
MINLIKEGTTNTIAINPATASIRTSFDLNLTQDYDLYSSSISLGLIGDDTSVYNKYMVFALSSSAIPSASGMYTYQLEEYSAFNLKWNTAAENWIDEENEWSDSGGKNLERVIDTGRAKIVGTDTPTYGTYTGSASNTGAYITYYR